MGLGSGKFCSHPLGEAWCACILCAVCLGCTRVPKSCPGVTASYLTVLGVRLPPAAFARGLPVVSSCAAPSLVSPLRRFWWIPAPPSVCLSDCHRLAFLLGGLMELLHVVLKPFGIAYVPLLNRCGRVGRESVEHLL